MQWVCTMSSSQEAESSGAVADQARHWVIEFDAGDVSAEDHARFTRWLNESPVHRKAFEDLQRTWRRCDVVQRLRTDPADPGVIDKWVRSRSMRRRVAPLAIAAALAAVACGIWLMQAPSVHELGYRTTVGEQRTIVLPDESLMTLNTRTRVQVRYSRDARRVELEQGEALFEVAADAGRPFLVLAGNGTLRAVGTTFAVYVRGDAVEVTVTEGTVEVLTLVKPTKEKRSVTIPNESDAGARVLTERSKLRYGKDVVEVVAAVTDEEIERTLAWRDGMLDFEATPLSEVIAEAGRYTTDELIIVDSELEMLEFTGYFRAGDVELLMRLLETNESIEARRVDRKTVHISRRGSSAD
jgi:transmembrane sensor